jgi:hypothetical protein
MGGGGSVKDLTSFLTFINIIQLAFSVFTFILFMVVRVPVKYQLTRNKGADVVTAAFAASTDSLTLYYAFYCLVCALAWKVSSVFSSLLLLDIVVKNSTTRDVLLAVSIPFKQLSATFILATFTIYIFAFFFFEYYRLHFAFGECNTLIRCFETVADFGLRSSGGIGDMMGFDGSAKRAMGPRFILDLLFFVLVLIILMNVIFGIIIDTFSELRELKKKRLEHTVGTCFICGIEKMVMDRAADSLDKGFRRHIREDHHMWSYLKFMIFIWVQDQDDDDGLELYVRQCLESDDLSWFPMDKALCLKEVQDSQEGGQALPDRLAAVHADLGSAQKQQTELTDQIESNMELLGKATSKLSSVISSGKAGRRGSSSAMQQSKRNSLRGRDT